MLSATSFVRADQQNPMHCHRKHRQPKIVIITLLAKCAVLCVAGFTQAVSRVCSNKSAHMVSARDLAKALLVECAVLSATDFTDADFVNLMNGAGIFADRQDLKELCKEEIAEALEPTAC